MLIIIIKKLIYYIYHFKKNFSINYDNEYKLLAVDFFAIT